MEDNFFINKNSFSRLRLIILNKLKLLLNMKIAESNKLNSGISILNNEIEKCSSLLRETTILGVTENSTLSICKSLE